MKLSSIQQDIMDEMYFVISFPKLMEAIHISSDDIRNNLLLLMNEKLIDRMRFNQSVNDYILFENNFERISDQDYFVATKAGLLIMHSHS